MGNKTQGPFRDAYNPTLQGWQLSRQAEDFNVWNNVTSGEEMEQYRFVISDVKEFQHQKEIFEFRYDSATLVSSKFFREDTQRELCSTYYKGTLFLERIPIRLSNINDLPYPDVLHLYHQTFRGFAELHEKMGYFIMEENMICLNQQGRVKVWANGQLEKSYPIDAIMGATGTEKEMVRRIIQLIDQNTDNLTLPQNIGALLQQADPSTFRDADMMVQNFAARHHTTIPTQIDSVLRREDIVRAADSVYLHSPLTVGNASANSAAASLSYSMPAMAKMSLIGSPALATTATFGHQTISSNVATSIIPQAMNHTFAPQSMQTFTHTNGPVSQTPVVGILPTSMTTIQSPSTTTITTNRQQRNIGLRSTTFLMRPTTNVGVIGPIVSAVGLANKHSGAVNVITQPGAGRQALHIEKLVSPKPTTGSADKEYELNSQNLLMRGSFNHRINSRSLVPKHFNTHHINLQTSRSPVVHSTTLHSTTTRNYSSMLNIGLKNNLVNVATKKIQQTTNTEQQTNQQNIESKPQPEKKLTNVKSQVITPVQSITNRMIESQQHQVVRTQRQTISPPTSHLMQYIGKMNQVRHQSLSQPVENVSQFRNSGNSAFLKYKQLATIKQHIRNKESSPSAVNPNVLRHVIAQPPNENKRVFATHNTTIANEAPIRGSHIFQSSQLHPGVQITYESSRIAMNTSDVYAPVTEAQISFGRNESNINAPIQNPAQSHVNVPTSQPKGVVVLNSQETLDTITYFKTKKEDHLTSHLPVTYSVLRESQEFLVKYGPGVARAKEPTGHGETAISGIRVSLGSHYNQEETNIGKSLYYNKQQYQQQSRQLDEPFKPIYSESQPAAEYYPGIQIEYQQKVKVTEKKIIESLNTVEMKYSMHEQTISTKQNDIRNVKDSQDVIQPYSHITNTSLADPQPIRQVVDEYSIKMDNDLRKDLQQMRKSYL